MKTFSNVCSIVNSRMFECRIEKRFNCHTIRSYSRMYEHVCVYICWNINEVAILDIFGTQIHSKLTYPFIYVHIYIHFIHSNILPQIRCIFGACLYHRGIRNPYIHNYLWCVREKTFFS